MIAHELRTPLTTVSAFAQLLGRPNLAPDVQERARSAIVSETRRLTRLVQDLTDAARLATGRFRLHLGACDLTEIVRQQVETMQFGTDRHTIRVELPHEPVRLVCDCDRVTQVLANLLGNAVAHTPGGEIVVRLSQEGDRVHLEVRDAGPGIPADRLETIFEPYVRLTDGDFGERPKGMGLGLYISKGIVEAHGGQIWAESAERGGGAIFHLILPLHTVADAVPMHAGEIGS
jgi:signal transduction histidine kinase